MRVLGSNKHNQVWPTDHSFRPGILENRGDSQNTTADILITLTPRERR